MAGNFLQYLDRIQTLAPDYGRRRLIGGIGAGLVSSLFGRNVLAGDTGASNPTTNGTGSVGTTAWLKPNKINDLEGFGAISKKIDVHAHFINASDVPVTGFILGPIMHASEWWEKILLAFLVPFADPLARIAPTAEEELKKLTVLSRQYVGLSIDSIAENLHVERKKHIEAQSQQFYDLVKGTGFETEYNRLPASSDRIKGLAQIPKLQEDSLAIAVAAAESPLDAESQKEVAKINVPDGTPYKEGTLAFIGYMLCYRWSNLRSYQIAFSEDKNSIGINHVLSALVDFDYWLDGGKPRSSHESQMRLHARLSELSNGYMRPIISYNPLRDIMERDGALKLVRTAITDKKFVGIKIYPPNGYYPWGNTALNPRDSNAGEIDKRLEKLWQFSDEAEVPVMAHTNETMGSDEAHDRFGKPKGWEQLTLEYKTKLNLKKPPRVNLGHFGGSGFDDKKNDWTAEFAALMQKPGGTNIFGDLGYWDDLQCGMVDPAKCDRARKRLENALRSRQNGAVGNTPVTDRVMYGTDWLMLSRSPHWANYPHALYEAIKKIPNSGVDNIFGPNAMRCFTRL
jgi:hypothetical protein